MAVTLNELAAVYWSQGRLAEAEPLFQRSLRIFGQVLGEMHPNVATVLENYADLLQRLERNDEAEALEARAATIRERLEENNTDST